ncbi:MAG: TrkH family potassium uptake protein [Alphaproteobacteria bacterium]
MAFTGIFFILGWLILFVGIAQLAMVLLAFAFFEYTKAVIFLEAGLITVFVGGGMVIALRNMGVDPDRRDGLPLLFLSAVFVPLFAALPLTAALEGLTIGQAWFEAVSMLTTTGLSMLGPPEDQGHSILLWRAFLGWLGGMWWLVIGIVMLTGLSIGGLQPSMAPVAHGEGETLMRRMRVTARLVLPLYGGATLVGAMALAMAGLHPFDAVVHALSAVSTSGVSSLNGSVTGFGLWHVEMLVLLLCLFGAFNITLLLRAAAVRGKALRADIEWPVVLIVGLVAALILIAESRIDGTWEGWRGAVDALFVGVSFATTTGFGSDLVVGPLGLFILLGAMIVGGAVASTAGGIHPARIALLLKHGTAEIQRLIYPHRVTPQRLAKQRVEPQFMRAVVAFLALYLATLAALTLGLSIGGLDLADAGIGALSALTSTGPALPLLGPGGVNGDDLSSLAKLVYAVGMVAGRLDLFAFLVIFLPGFWRR